MAGYTGKVAFVDLSSRSVSIEELPEQVYRSFIGGAGLGVKVLYDRMKPGVDPLGLENMLGFVPGLLNGTGTPMATKFTVVTKSPLSSTWGDANSGGLFSSELKAAGFDGIFFAGAASEPVYCLINDETIEIRSAANAWGKNTRETAEILRNETGEKRLRIACIGPSGESKSLIASIITDDGRAAARSGVGAVMGSKHLKAVAVKGSRKVEVRDSDALSRLRSETITLLKDVDRLPFIKVLSGPGTCAGPLGLVPAGASPIKNWSLIGDKAFPDYVKIAGEHITKYQVRKAGCGNCPINCGGTLSVKEGPFATEGRKPEYETIAAFGTMLLNGNVESIIKANDLCDLYGMDTISTGTTLAFAMECYERDILGKEETGGIELTWGNADAIIAMLHKMGKREGIGAVLADGVARAARQIGKGVEVYAMHVHGQEPGFHDPRFLPLRGLSYLVHPTPGRHMTSMASIRLEGEGKIGTYPELQRPEGDDEVEKRGRIHALGSSYSQTFGNSGMCLFAISAGSNIPLVEFICAATGWDFTAAEAIAAGKRSLSFQQAFNMRQGLTARDFALPSRLTAPPAMGPFAGKVVDFDALRRSYYQAMGWEPLTGNPGMESLAE
ncbi:MAG: aldehyde ferredoxin oxidoreductase family protein [Syntrophorhabdales bacterium]|jgi:aldehyde:ferredoxin oxidoreductase